MGPVAELSKVSSQSGKLYETDRYVKFMSSKGEMGKVMMEIFSNGITYEQRQTSFCFLEFMKSSSHSRVPNRR